MILGVSPIFLGNNRVQNYKQSKQKYEPSFGGLKNDVIKYTGLGLAALTMFSAVACNRPKNTAVTEHNDTIEVISTTNVADSIIAEEEKKQKETPHKIYHYEPADTDVTANNYAWSETIYPNGTIKRDSMGYDITIEPNGERIVEYKTTDMSGNVTTIDEYKDGTKIEQTDYNIPNETLYVKTTYWANGKMKLREYFNKYTTDSLNQAVDSARYEYNENGMLLKWINNIKDPERNDSNNIYDRYGRLEYDDVANEKLYYKGNNKIPYQAVSEYDGCQRFRIFNQDGTIQKIYFKAEDGTITDADE